MPKRVDHEVRRRQIIEALYRITIKGGLGAASFREVAGEAGVSVSLVQHYFGAKDQLLLAALQHLAGRVATQGQARIGALGPGAGPREVVEAVVELFLPTDAESREAMVLFYAFQIAALTDPGLARSEALGVPRGLTDFLAAQIAAAQCTGATAPGIDPAAEAVLLVAVTTGLALGVLAGQQTLEAAETLAAYALDRLFIPVAGSPDDEPPPPTARRARRPRTKDAT